MMQMWIFGLLINLFLFYSVFDIYFKSPVVQVPVIHEGIVISGIRRIVIVIGDGLRADSFFELPQYSPYLTSIMNSTKVAWGISDTRVPTESRPGHVALFSGLYEDPSAVFSGWKENMVPFDSVFNRSTYGIALGSPDVVQMFRKGVPSGKIHVESYPSDWQDFLAANSSALDLWVLEKFEQLIQARAIPNHDKVLIFLHLLGIDNTGHAMKPHSLEYNSNIQVVDNIVRSVEAQVENYFNDKQTLFIFTSDHGMTDWGSHGSGSKAETETPFVIWGPGIKRTKGGRLKQADFAGLMAGALNIPFPTNSVGRFPSDFWTLKPFAYDALRANFLQIHELMLIKKQLASTTRRLPIIFFEQEDDISAIFNESYGFADASDYDKAIESLHKAINMSLEGVHYYERYDQDLLIFLSVTTFILWMILISTSILFHGWGRALNYSQRKFWVHAAVLSPIITKGLIGWSLWRLAYTFVPLYLSRLIWASWGECRRNGSSSTSKIPVKSLLILVVLCGVGTEILVNSFHERAVLTLGLILNAFWSMKGKKLSTWQRFLWLGSIAILGLFPIAPVIGKKQNPFFMSLGPLVSGIMTLVLLQRIPPLRQRDNLILASQTGLLFSVVILIHFPTFIITRIVSWSSVIFSFLGPTLTSSSNFTVRLLSIFIGICTPFSLLSLSYESLFLPCLFYILLFLMRFEASEGPELIPWQRFLCSSDIFSCHEDGSNSISNWQGQENLHKAFRRGWLHLFFVFLSFFGTGNIGSVSSFDPTAVRCFVSIFSPFVMMVALLEKIVGPFLLVSCFFRILFPSRVQVERNFLIVLFLCQGMALHTFLMVRNTGSWLEIGTSISHYVIVQCTTLFLFLLHFSSNFLISASLLPSHYIPQSTARPDASIQKTK